MMSHFGTLLYTWSALIWPFKMSVTWMPNITLNITNYCLYQLDLYITALPRQPVRFSIFCGYGIGSKILQKCGKNICFKIGASESAIYSQVKVRKINRCRSKVTLTRGWVCFQALNSSWRRSTGSTLEGLAIFSAEVDSDATSARRKLSEPMSTHSPSVSGV